MRYVIVGGSIAAHTAYRQLKAIDPGSSVTVISRENTQPYSKMLLPYMIHTDSVEENMFFRIDPEDLRLKERVVALDTEQKTVATDRGTIVPYDKLLIATGADAKIPSYSGNYSAESVVGVRYLQDIENIMIRIATCPIKKAVLVGAGLVTLEVGWALVQRGIAVDFVVRSNRILSQILDKKAADKVENYITSHYPVRFFKGEDVESIEENGSTLHIKLAGSGELEGCVMVVGKGVNPNTDFLENTPVKVDYGVVVDNRLQTSVDDIYAVGDVAAFDDVVMPGKHVHAIWPVAIEQAKAAARNMAGIKTWYMPEFSRNALPVFNITIFTGGISNRDEFDVYEKENGLEHRKIMLKDGKLVGFILIGELANAGAYTYIAKKRIKVDDKINKLLYGTITINDQAYR